MNGTLFALDLLDSPAGFALALAIGILFGFFLEQAGFGSSRRLTGVFYFKDMAVVKVMFTAVVTAMVGYRYLVALGWLNPADVHVLDTFWTSQIAGGLLFGVGFVMGGWCPGTAFVGVASGKLDALVFLGGAILGSIAFNEVFPLLQPAYDRCAGPLHLPGTLGLSDAILVLAFCLVAVLAFAGCTRIERAGGAPPPNPVSLRRNRLAALALVLLALGVFALPQPAPRGVVAPIDTQGPAEPQAEVSAPSASALADGLGAVALAQDHIAPADLAAALMSGEPGLSVIDVRPADDYRAFHLPGAIHLPVDRLLAEAGARVARSGRVVLCSNGTTHAAQAWLALRVAGWTNVLVLTDGMLGFWRECLTPPSLQPGADPRAAEAARAGFEARRAFFLLRGGSGAAAAPVAARPLVEPGLDRHVVSTAWLAERLNDPTLRIVDARAKSVDYTAGHIPNAIHLAVDAVRGTIAGIPSMLLPADELATLLGRCGIGRDHAVVVYSDALRDATLVGLALQRVGHARFAVLNGGIGRWTAESRPLSKAFPRVDPTRYTPGPGADTFTVSVDDVAAAAARRVATILDVRPPEYFEGKKSEEARPGRIPGAINRELKHDLVPGQETWRSIEDLKAGYAKLGIEPGTPVIVHCRTGHQASQTYFALRHLLGFENVRWFDASWAGWAARPELPVEKSPGS